MKAGPASLCVAATAAALVLAWQTATVHYNYRGNWTALFCIGADAHRPPALEAGSWLFPKTDGYDGQLYRMVAHDPWMKTDLWRFLDMPVYRQRRILLPAAAWLAAFGDSRRIDASYILMVLLSVLAGTWYTARWSILQGRPAWWGLGFLLLPGTLISVDRMTVDVAGYALAAAGLYYWRRRCWTGCWIAGAAAFLDRELGLLLIAALVGMSLWERSWRRAAAFASAALPGCWWYAHVARTLPAPAELVPSWLLHWPVVGAFLAIVHPPDYALPGWLNTFTQCLDGISIAGLMVAVFLAIAAVRRRPLTLESLLSLLYAGLWILVSREAFWPDAYAYLRAFSLLAGLVAWRAVTERQAWLAVPLVCMLGRVVWQMGPQALGIVRALCGQSSPS